MSNSLINIRIWLAHLKEHHPGYLDLVINEDRLRQLPDGEGRVEHALAGIWAPASLENALDEISSAVYQYHPSLIEESQTGPVNCLAIVRLYGDNLMVLTGKRREAEGARALLTGPSTGDGPALDM